MFDTDDDTALAHCVSEDLVMPNRMVREFKERFKKFYELKKQDIETGGCAYI